MRDDDPIRPMRDDDPIRRMNDEDLDALIDGWSDSSYTRSRHLDCAIALAKQRGHTPGDPSPIQPGERLPGCNCPECTGIPTEHPARKRPVLARQSKGAMGAGQRALNTDAARQVPILDIVARLELGDPRRQGKEWVICCPFHDDRKPSLCVEAEKGVWYCHPCAKGGDGIDLVMQVRGCTFAEAVRELVP